MIPLCTRESVSYCDDDNITWTFKPKTGDLERRLFEFAKPGEDIAEHIAKSDSFFDEIFIGAKGEKFTFPKDKKGSEVFSQEEKGVIFGYWHKANTLDAQKKSN